jgi:hypothetical protein
MTLDEEVPGRSIQALDRSGSEGLGQPSGQPPGMGFKPPPGTPVAGLAERP